MAPTAKAPRAGPHQPQRASAVVGVATVATPIVAAAATAVRGFLMASPQAMESKGHGQPDPASNCPTPLLSGAPPAPDAALNAAIIGRPTASAPLPHRSAPFLSREPRLSLAPHPRSRCFFVEHPR